MKIVTTVFVSVGMLVLSSCGAIEEQQNKEFMEACNSEAMKSYSADLGMDEDAFKVLVNDYCSCSLESIRDKGLSGSEIEELSMSEKQEIMKDCITDFSNKVQESAQ